jgi:cobalt-zinc-cadmium efflux system protein
MAVALLILRSAWAVIAKSSHILLEGTPEGLDVEDLRRHLREFLPDIVDIHHVHVWSLTNERPLLTLHARIDGDADHDDALRKINAVLAERYGIDHTTVQIEKGDCADVA